LLPSRQLNAQHLATAILQQDWLNLNVQVNCPLPY
jgi:hypothetical protein